MTFQVSQSDFGLPRRGDRGVERVDEGVHVGRRQVVLLVPGGRRQDDVAEDRAAGHPEVDRGEQVQASLGRLVGPRDVPGSHLRRRLHRGRRAVGAEQVAQEVLVALGRGAQQVGAPQRQDARVVVLRLGVLHRELQGARLELPGDVRRRLHARGVRVVGEGQRAAVERRVARAPAQPHRLGQQVHHGPAGEDAGAGVQVVGAEGVVAVLAGVHVPVRRLVHVPRRAVPVEREGHVLEAHDRADLLLAHVVRPAAAVAALAAGDRGEHQHRAVDLVGVEPVVDPGPHQDHPATLGVDRVLRPLAGQALDLRGRDARVGLLPGRGRGVRRVVVAGRPLPGEAVARDAVLGEHQVQDRGHEPVPHPCDRYAASVVADLAVGVVEARQLDLDGLAGPALVVGVHRERRVDVPALEVPPAQPLVAEAVADGALRDADLAGAGVDDGRLPHRVLGAALRVPDVAGDEVLAGTVGTVAGGLEADEVRQVGVLLVVVGEERHVLVDEELLEHHVAHRHRERSVRAGGGGDPLVGELHVLRVVGGDGDDLLAAVARLRHPVRVRRARHRDVGAPHDQVAGVPPVPRLGHVGLVAEHLRRGVGQVGVPVVEGQHRGADELEEARSRGVGDRRHRRDRREPRDPVRAPALDRVDVGRGDDLGHLVPAGADQAALAARLLVEPGLLLVLDDRPPRDHRVAVLLLGGPEELQQDAPDVGVAHPGRAVGVPAERGAAGAAAGLVLRLVGAGRGVVGLLGLPGDDPVLDVDLPRARAGAVDPVRRADHLVVAPAVAVERVPLPTALLEQGPAVLGRRRPGEERPTPDEGRGEGAFEGGHAVSDAAAVRRTTVRVSSSVSAAVAASSHSPMA